MPEHVLHVLRDAAARANTPLSQYLREAAIMRCSMEAGADNPERVRAALKAARKLLAEDD